jgi:hypothetical protein
MGQVADEGERVVGTIHNLPGIRSQHPMCENCGSPLPTFEGASLTFLENVCDTHLVSITFHVICRCGAEHELNKKLTNPDLLA